MEKILFKMINLDLKHIRVEVGMNGNVLLRIQYKYILPKFESAYHILGLHDLLQFKLQTYCFKPYSI